MIMTQKKELINSHITENNLCLEQIANQSDILVQIVDMLIKARNNGKKIFTMGNGGSGSTASHFVSDLLKTAIIKNEKRFSAFSLTDNIPVILAWSNDVSFDSIFVEQLKNHLSKGDILIGFSGSGKSKNILKAFQYAKKHGAICIGITGMSGGNFPKHCDLYCIVPSNNMLTIESMHLLICHCIIETIRKTGKPLFSYN